MATETPAAVVRAPVAKRLPHDRNTPWPLKDTVRVAPMAGCDAGVVLRLGYICLIVAILIMTRVVAHRREQLIWFTIWAGCGVAVVFARRFDLGVFALAYAIAPWTTALIRRRFVPPGRVGSDSDV